MKDQAEQLRHKMNDSESTQVDTKTRVITVTSGKGGVGKSNFSLNFALSLMKHNKSVLVFDMDLGLANLDVLMGCTPKKNLVDIFNTECSIWDVIEEGPGGLKFIAGGSGFQYLFEQSEKKISSFLLELNSLQGKFDYLILDTGAGLSKESLRLMLSADDVMVVTSPEPTALTDAYAVLKMVNGKEKEIMFHVIVNRCTFPEEGRRTAMKLKMVSKQFLNKEIDHLGDLPEDIYVSKSVKKQSPFLLEYPKSNVSLAMDEMTRKYLQLSTEKPRGMKHFLKKMISYWDG